MIAAFLQRAAYIETMALAWWSRIDVQYLVSHVLGAPLGSVGTGTLAAVVLGIGIYGLRNPPDPERAADPARVTTIACLTILTCIYHHAYDTLLLDDASGVPRRRVATPARAGARRAPHADARASPLPRSELFRDRHGDRALRDLRLVAELFLTAVNGLALLTALVASVLAA